MPARTPAASTTPGASPASGSLERTGRTSIPEPSGAITAVDIWSETACPEGSRSGSPALPRGSWRPPGTTRHPDAIPIAASPATARPATSRAPAPTRTAPQPRADASSPFTSTSPRKSLTGSCAAAGIAGTGSAPGANAPLRQVHRAKHGDPLLPQRVVHHLAHIIDDHGGAIFGGERRPSRQLRRVWITRPRKRDPGVTHFVGQGHCLGASAGQPRRDLHVVERERNLHRVRRLQPPSLHRRFPPEIIQVHRPFAQRRAPLRDLHGWRPVPVVAGNQEVDIRRRRTRIQLA